MLLLCIAGSGGRVFDNFCSKKFSLCSFIDMAAPGLQC